MSVATPLARSGVRSTTTISRHIPPRSINDSTVAAPTAPTPITPTFTIPLPHARRTTVPPRLTTDHRRVHEASLWASEGGQQLGCRPVDESLLGVGADLDQGDVGEPGRLELADPGEVPPEVGTARHLGGHVLLADRPGRLLERRRHWELGVDPPATGEPAELLHRPPHRGRLIGVVGECDLADPRLPGASRVVEYPGELGTGLGGHTAVR